MVLEINISHNSLFDIKYNHFKEIIINAKIFIKILHENTIPVIYQK